MAQSVANVYMAQLVANIYMAQSTGTVNDVTGTAKAVTN